MFPLPYVMNASTLFYGVTMLQNAGAFQKLPKDIQEKMVKARDAWHALRIKAEDLDRIDDQTWGVIAAKLGLEWKK